LKQLIIQSQAAQEADEVAKWYEDQFPGLGVEFLLELDVALGRVINNPDIYQPVYEDARRVLVRRFPYAAYLFRKQILFRLLQFFINPETRMFGNLEYLSGDAYPHNE
jgi:toxin ParE1/3/4